MGSCVSGQSTVQTRVVETVKKNEGKEVANGVADNNEGRWRGKGGGTVPRELKAFEGGVGGGLGRLMELLNSQFYEGIRLGNAPERLHPDSIAPVVRGLAHAIDSVLNPILAASLDATRQEAEENSDEASLSDISTAVLKSVSKHHPDPEFPAAVHSGIHVLGWLVHGTVNFNPIQEVTRPDYEMFYVKSINKLFTCMRNTLVVPSAGSMSKYQLEAGLEHLEAILRCVGIIPGLEPASPKSSAASEWFSSLPMYALDPITKGSLLYIICNEDQRRLSLNPIRRHAVLSDALALVKTSGYWTPAPKKMYGPNATAQWSGKRTDFLKFFPAFEGPDGVIEYGEGHGPRKEFFDLAAEALTSAWGPDIDLSKKCTGELVKGSKTVMLVVNCDKEVVIPAWSVLVFALPDLRENFEAEVVKTERNEETLKITLSTEAPVSSTSPSIALRLRASPIFQGDSTGYWFRETESLGQAPSQTLTPSQLQILDTCGLAGWLLSQCLGNGVTMNLGLPVVFYKMLKKWPDWDPSAVPLSELSPDLYSSLEAIKNLPERDYREVLEVDGLPGNLTREEYIRRRVQDHVKNDIHNQMTAFTHGFFSTGLKDVGVFNACRPEELRLVLQGRGDDGVSDFDFHEEFHILESQDFREGDHNLVFKDILWKVIEGGLGAPRDQVAYRKRQFVKFLTGRSMLPAHAKQESLNIVVPYTMFAAREFAAYLSRLPASHTCDNTLEIPNYMESLIFKPGSVWYAKAGVEVGDTVTFQMKAGCWAVLGEDDKRALKAELESVLVDRLSVAVLNSASYELDFIEHEHHDAVPQAPPPPPPPPPLPLRNPDPPKASFQSTTTSRTSLTTPLQDPVQPLLSPPRYPMLDTQPPTALEGSKKKLFIDITKTEAVEGVKNTAVDCGDPWDTEDLDVLLKKLQG
eukprot:TRINITY_DN14800_c0_g1_i3.p1 TRINITY_DN14800_c0_g1~~TRINITY_DN14800_c0_g1_i3.p1  ORF type:complete len:918 (+),score=143.44 TRINITY_DN14800_c0_g1_i3:62-2815(+)